MKNLLLFLCVSFILLSCSSSVLTAEKSASTEKSINNLGYVTAYEGYQLAIKKMRADGYNDSCINLIDIKSLLNTSLYKFGYIVSNMSFSGDDIGKSNYWLYSINYNKDNKDNYLYVYCVIENGVPIIDINQQNKEFAKIQKVKSNRYITLTKENDSPVFVKKLIENSNFSEASIISLSYLPQYFKNFAQFQFQEDIPYWMAVTNDESKRFLLLSDNNIVNNSLEYIKN